MQVIIDWLARVFWQDPKACFETMDGISDLVACLNLIIWSEALIYLALGAGLFYSILTRFVQVRMFREMLRLLFSSKESDRGISSFQALAVSLSGRVGTGNIAGVAAAIGFGGPGAVFWMWVVAFLGSATAYVESALGQIYKEVDEGQYRGGPAYYIEKAMGQKWYAWIFAIVTIFACGVLLPGVQSNSIGNAANLAAGGVSMLSLFGTGETNCTRYPGCRACYGFRLHSDGCRYHRLPHRRVTGDHCTDSWRCIQPDGRRWRRHWLGRKTWRVFE
jgi:hypothetical protein